MFLEMGGYRVLDAADPLSALELAAQHEDIHLTLTDDAMPQMNGRVFADELLRRRPDMKVLFMSGYADTETLNRLGVSGESIFQKPFDPDTLLRKIREVLGG